MNDQTNMNRGFLKDKLGDYQVDPPEKVWDEISGQMSKGRNRRGFYILLLASAASIALALTLGIHFFGPDLPAESFVEEMDEVIQPAEREEIADDQAVLALQQPRSLESESGMQTSVVQGTDPVIDAYPVIDPDPVTDPDLAADADPAAIPEFVMDADSVMDSDPSKDIIAELLPDTAANMNTDPFLFMEEEKKRDPRWMVGAAVSPLYSYRDADAAAKPSNPDE